MPILLASQQFGKGGKHGDRKANRAGICVQGGTRRIRVPWLNHRDLRGTVFHDGGILGKFGRRRSTRRACVGIGLGAIILFPILYGIVGGIAGVIGAAVYNLAAGWVGGLEVDIS